MTALAAATLRAAIGTAVTWACTGTAVRILIWGFGRRQG